MKNWEISMVSKILIVLECINLMLDDGRELYYHCADNSVYVKRYGEGMKLLKSGKSLNQFDILHYLIGFRENLCLN